MTHCGKPQRHSQGIIIVDSMIAVRGNDLYACSLASSCDDRNHFIPTVDENLAAVFGQ